MSDSPQAADRVPRLPLVLGLALLLGLALFWRLGDASFWDPDEAHYAEASRELIQTGDWLAPQYNGAPFFDKPIVFYWIQALPMAAGLDPELSARLGGAVSGVLLVAVTWWLGTTLAGAATGALAALLLAANPGLFGLARYAILDLPFTTALFAGVACVAVAALRARPALEWGGYLLVGVAAAIKGPLALVLCGIAFVLAAAVSAELRRRLLALRWVRGFLLAAGIGALWPAYMLWRFRQAFVDNYLLKENFSLYTTTQYQNQPGWGFYLGIIAVGMLPWTPLIVARAVDHWRGGRRSGAGPTIGQGADLFDILLWCWVGGLLAFFSFSSFKLDHYIFPTSPALCLIAARAWLRWRLAPELAPGPVRWSIALIGPALIAAGVAMAYAAVLLLDLSRGFLVVPAVLTGAGVVAWRDYVRGASAPWLPVAPLVALGTVFFGAVLWVLPKLEAGKVVPDVSQWIDRRAGPDDRIAGFRLNRWEKTYRFYVNRPVTQIESDDEARQFFSDPRPYYCLMSGELFAALKAAGVPLRAAYTREGIWVTSGRALWRAPAARTTFVVAVPDAAPTPR